MALSIWKKRKKKKRPLSKYSTVIAAQLLPSNPTGNPLPYCEPSDHSDAYDGLG